MGIWIISFLLLGVVQSDPIGFDPFFSPDSAFFSPPDDGSFGSFAGSFGDSSSLHLASEFPTVYPSETANLPLYTDGRPTPPQETLSKLQKEYKSSLHKGLSNYRQAKEYRPSSGTPSFSKRIPRFQNEPHSSASEERRVETKKPSPSLGVTSYNSKQVELQTGFVPILSRNSAAQRTQTSQSSVIKNIEPPILTATSVSSQPTLFKVSASVHSSSRAVPAAPRNNTVDLTKSRLSAGYSRFLNLNNSAKSYSTSSSSSESVVSRVVVKPPTDRVEERSRSLGSGVSEDVRLAAKKTLDINCDGSRDLGWCELGDKYPKKYVNQVVAACQEVIERMYVEVPHSFERLSDTSNFKSELDNSSSSREARERGSHDAWSWASYFHQGSLCDSETGFLRPETAKDTSGKWNIIVQTDSLKQRVPIEMCRKTNSSCKKMVNCGLKSQCLQKYNYHLLLSVNPVQKHDCPFMKLYRFPSACVCHVE